MACKWRIRHKLIFGLGLVVLILAVMLGGTLHGLCSYIATMKSMDAKLAELHKADDLKAKINGLAAPSDPLDDLAGEPARLRGQIEQARQALRAYQMQLQYTLDRRRDPDKGREEAGLIQALDERLTRLDGAIVAATDFAPVPLQGTRSVRSDPTIAAKIVDLEQTTEDLHVAIYNDFYRRINAARNDQTNSLIIVVSTTVLGVLMMVVFLRFFYRWVFYPIRDLELGVGRIARGDFDHRLDVRSGDEMEELASAFNTMTDKLGELYGDLSRQVNERSRQLIRSERLASVGYLAAGVAHEINNPLASIAFCSEALEQRLGESPAGRQLTPADAEVVAKYLKMIQQEAFRCKDITQRLLEFSRSGDRHREPTNLAEIVQAVADMVKHLPNAKSKPILIEGVRTIVAWVNAPEIKSVVLNLVINALDSMDEGGTLRIQLEQRGGEAFLKFVDNGCGMNDEVLENIFEPFFTRSRTGKGTGLGLTISHRIINQHGGDIEAASAGPNQGSTFTVRLPLQATEAVAPAGSRQDVLTFAPRTGESAQEEMRGHAAA